MGFVEESFAHRGKQSDKWASYLPLYSKVVEGLQRDVESLLEIGVQRGGSLEIWAKTLPEAKRIIGCDIDPTCGMLTFTDSRITVLVGDASSSQTVEQIEALCSRFDLIVDDGSHRSSDIIQTFARYFPLLAPGGAFIIEDLHCAYWPDWDGGLLRPDSAVEFLKRLIDVVNAEHWPGDFAAVDVLSDFLGDLADNQRARLSAALPFVKAVSFFDSVCVIETYRDVPASRLGPRILLGGDAGVESTAVRAREMAPASDPRGDLRDRFSPANEDAAWAAVPQLEAANLALEEALRKISALEQERAHIEGALEEVQTELARQLQANELVTAERDRLLNSRTWRWGRKLARLIGR